MIHVLTANRELHCPAEQRLGGLLRDTDLWAQWDGQVCGEGGGRGGRSLGVLQADWWSLKTPAEKLGCQNRQGRDPRPPHPWHSVFFFSSRAFAEAIKE